jgi:hypothetical protein
MGQRRLVDGSMSPRGAAIFQAESILGIKRERSALAPYDRPPLGFGRPDVHSRDMRRAVAHLISGTATGIGGGADALRIACNVSAAGFARQP